MKALSKHNPVWGKDGIARSHRPDAVSREVGHLDRAVWNNSNLLLRVHLFPAKKAFRKNGGNCASGNCVIWGLGVLADDEHNKLLATTNCLSVTLLYTFGLKLATTCIKILGYFGQDSQYTVFHRLFVVRALCNCSIWFKHPHIL